MIKHTQAIRRQKLANCLSMFDHCVGLALKGLKRFWQGFYRVTISINPEKFPVKHVKLYAVVLWLSPEGCLETILRSKMELFCENS